MAEGFFCEAALSVEDSRGKPAGRLVAARVAALEGAHQAEVNELRRAPWLPAHYATECS